MERYVVLIHDIIPSLFFYFSIDHLVLYWDGIFPLLHCENKYTTILDYFKFSYNFMFIVLLHLLSNLQIKLNRYYLSFFRDDPCGKVNILHVWNVMEWEL